MCGRIACVCTVATLCVIVVGSINIVIIVGIVHRSQCAHIIVDVVVDIEVVSAVVSAVVATLPLSPPSAFDPP